MPAAASAPAPDASVAADLIEIPLHNETGDEFVAAASALAAVVDRNLQCVYVCRKADRHT